MSDGKVVLVDDNETVLKSLKIILTREFKTVTGISDPALIPAILRNNDVDVVLLDMNFGTGKQQGNEGLFWLDHIISQENPPEVILITAFGDIELAVSSLKKGASDFIIKPWDNEKLLTAVRYARERRSERKQSSFQIESETQPDDNESFVQLLIDFLLRKYAATYGKVLPRITSQAFQKLSGLAGKSDLNTLQQTIERAVLLSDSTLLDVSDFYMEDQPASRPVTLEEMEKQFIREVLDEKKGNLTLCAQQLNISRQTLYNKLKKYGL